MSKLFYTPIEEMKLKLRNYFPIQGIEGINTDLKKARWFVHPYNCSIIHLKSFKNGMVFYNLLETNTDKSFTRSGYKMVSIEGKNYYLHRIVASSCLVNPDPEHLTHVRHKTVVGLKKRDNSVTNLEWVTKSDMYKEIRGNQISKPKKAFGRYSLIRGVFKDTDGTETKMTFPEYISKVEKERGTKVAENIIRQQQKRYGNSFEQITNMNCTKMNQPQKTLKNTGKH